MVPGHVLASRPRVRVNQLGYLTGRLVGLPPQCCYLDEPTSEVTNDVCVRWNAPLVRVASYLAHAQPSPRPDRSAARPRRIGQP